MLGMPPASKWKLVTETLGLAIRVLNPDSPAGVMASVPAMTTRSAVTRSESEPPRPSTAKRTWAGTSSLSISARNDRPPWTGDIAIWMSEKLTSSTNSWA